MKRITKILCAILAVAIVVSGGLFALNSIGKSMFLKSEFSPAASVGVSEKTLRELTESENLVKEMDEATEIVKKDAQPIDEKYLPQITKCQNAIVKYFNDVYSIDETQAIKEIKMYIFNTSEKTEALEGISGFAIDVNEDGSNHEIYFNKDYMEAYFIPDGTIKTNNFSGDEATIGDFNGLVIHETIHCLDKNVGDDGRICEGIAEYMTKVIAEHSDMEYSLCAYDYVTQLASEIVSHDKDLIPAIFTQKDFSYDEYFKSKYKVEFFDEYDQFLKAAAYTEKMSNSVKYALEYYTTQIVKSVDPDFSADYSITNLCPFFGLRYIFSR